MVWNSFLESFEVVGTFVIVIGTRQGFAIGGVIARFVGGGVTMRFVVNNLLVEPLV